MASVDDILSEMRRAPSNVRFDEVAKVCQHYFGAPRQSGTSHVVFKMPWLGDPRVNLQRGEGGKAKAYQVKQVVRAIDQLLGMREDVENGG